MNWNQRYNSTTHEERLDTILLMLRSLEARQSKRVFARGWLIRERRRAAIAHFVGERRRSFPWKRLVRLAMFAFILCTTTVSVILVAYNVTLFVGLLIVLAYEIALIAMMYTRPKRLGWSSA